MQATMVGDIVMIPDGRAGEVMTVLDAVDGPFWTGTLVQVRPWDQCDIREFALADLQPWDETPPVEAPGPPYAACMAADAAWHAELVRVYGRDAGNARYDHRGYATEKLATLKNEKIRTDAARRGEL